MATRSITPRAADEGGIGTAAKKWALGWINALVVTTLNGIGITGTAGKTITVTQDTSLDEAVAMSSKATQTSGTFEAGLACGTSGTITLAAVGKTLKWVRTGQQITITGELDVESVSSPVGTLSVTGLPVANGNNSYNSVGAIIYADVLEAAAATAVHGFIYQGLSTITIRIYAAGNGAAVAAANQCKAGTTFRISATYFVS